jgi:sortase A
MPTNVRRLLAIFGLACLIFYGVVTLQATIYQRKAKAQIADMVSAQHTTAIAVPSTSSPNPIQPLAQGELIGRVDIPRLKLSAAVAEGDDDSTLGKAVGHLPDTPLPWDRRGNVAFAAHRDGLFRGLKNIRIGDDVKVVTAKGEYLYRVQKTHIVDPDDVWVLAPTSTPTITLITCYPFSYVGHAPQRFIVQAEMVGGIEGTILKGKTEN